MQQMRGNIYGLALDEIEVEHLDIFYDDTAEQIDGSRFTEKLGWFPSFARRGWLDQTI